MGAVKFEHFALNVPEAHKHAQCHVDHAGFRIARQLTEPPFTTFLADEAGRVFPELYSNPQSECTDFKSLHPLKFHFAVVSAAVKADRAKFEAAGATLCAEEMLPDGGKLTMLRDPRGVPLQLCQRTKLF